MKNYDEKQKRALIVFVSIFVLLALSVVAVGYMYYISFKTQFRAQTERQLASIAELKMNELANWRKERLIDANFIYANVTFSKLTARYITNPQDAEAQTQILAWLREYDAYDQYDQVNLLDAQGKVVLAATSQTPDSVIVDNIPTALKSKQTLFVDFYRSARDTRVYLAILIPILDQQQKAIGVIALRINPETYLYPFIRQWPTDSASAETLLVRRAGNDVVFLNELRFQAEAELTLRIPLEKTETLSVKAALGQTGIMEGIDYRGEPIIGDVRNVPASPWFLVTKMDSAEVYAPSRERLWQTLLLIGAAIFSTGAGLIVVWRKQQLRSYQAQAETAETLRESEERFRSAFQHSAIGIALVSLEGKWLKVNSRMCEIVGYSEDELLTKTFRDITHPDDLNIDADYARQLLAGEIQTYTVEKRYSHKNGNIVWVLLARALVKDGAGAPLYFISQIEDITQRMRAEEELQKAHDELESRVQKRTAELANTNATLQSELVKRQETEHEIQLLLNTTQIIGEAENVETALTSALRLVCENTGWEVGEVWEPSPESNHLKLGEPYYSQIGSIESFRNISHLIKFAPGVGLPGQVWESGKPVWIRDVTADAHFERADFAEETGLKTAIGIPIMANGATTAVMVFFMKKMRREDERMVEVISGVAAQLGATLQRKQVESQLAQYSEQLEDMVNERTLKLSESEERIHLIIDSALDAIITIDSLSVITGWNPQAENIFGWSQTEAVGQSLTDLIIPSQHRAAHQHGVERFMATGEGSILNQNIEITALRRDGSEFPVELTIAAIKSDEGFNFSAFIRDVTARKQANDNLRASEEKLRLSLEAAHHGMYDINIQTQSVAVNREYLQMLGYDPDTHIETNEAFSERMHPDDKEIAAKAYSDCVHGLTPEYHVEFRQRAKDGGWKWILSLGKVVEFDGAGKPLRMLGTHTDVTERKQTEEALKKSNALYRAVTQSANDAIISADSAGNVVGWNHGAEQIFGYATSEINGQALTLLMPSRYRDDHTNGMKRALAGGEKHFIGKTAEVVGQRKDGSEFPLEISLSEWQVGEDWFYTAIIRDVTERKQAEAQLRMKSAALEASANAIAITGMDGKFEWVNPAFTTLTGYMFEEAIGKDPSLLKSGKHDQDFYQNLWTTIVNGEVWRGEVINRRKDGRLYNEDQTITPVRDETGKIVQFVAIKQDVTEQKLAEEQIRQLSRAVEASPTSIVITDTQGNIQYVNPKFIQLTGYTLSDVIGENPKVLQSHQTPPETYRELWDAITNGQEWHGEFCNRKKNGELYWELASISPIMDDHDVVTHYVAVKEDITERRAIQKKLEKQNDVFSVLHQITLEVLNRRNVNDLLQVIVERAAALLDAPYVEFDWVVGEELEIRAATQNMASIVGKRFTREQLKLSWQAYDTGKSVVINDYAALPERADIDAYSRLHANMEIPVMAGVKCIAILSVGRTKLGHTFVEDEIDTGVIFSRLIGLVLDNAHLYESALNEIAERKRAEALLQENESRFRQIVENTFDVIYRTDLEGNFTYVNLPALHLLGLTDEAQAVGKNYLDLVAPDSRQNLKRFYDRQILQRTPNTYSEFLSQTAEGEEIWLGQNVQLIMDDDSLVGFQAVARDVTQLKQAHEALSIARDQALEASQLKSQLLARVSHELRTPLSGVLGYAELLNYEAFGRLNKKQKDASQQIIASANYLTNLIEDLLDEAQINSKSLVLASMPFSPAEILTKVETTMSVLAKNKGLKLITSVSPDLPPTLLGDLKRLQQIIINLAGNAMKFTTKGEVRISLLRSSPVHWAIQIADTGAGIPAEAQAYVFEPFRQVNNSITRENRGSGLGLAITKQLVELMGGKIALESEVGKGSAFTITLPIQKQTEQKNG